MPLSKHRVWLIFASFSALLFLGLQGCTTKNRADRSSNQSNEENIERVVKKRMNELFDYFEEENRYKLTDALSDNYLGSRIQFESNLENQFQQFDSINIEYYVDRTIERSGPVEVKFQWNRRWKHVDKNDVRRRSGNTIFRFVNQEGVLVLQQIKGKNPFF